MAEDRTDAVVAEGQAQRGRVGLQGGQDEGGGLGRVTGLGAVTAGDGPTGLADLGTVARPATGLRPWLPATGLCPWPPATGPRPWTPATKPVLAVRGGPRS